MKEYISRRISAVHITDAAGNLLPADVVDRAGRSLISGEIVAPPSLGPAIANRTYTVGDNPVTIDLSERFIGAISYGMTPTNINGVTRSGPIVTINPVATRAPTVITVSGTNSGGTVSMQFTLTINAVAPTLTQPLPDQSLELGGGNVTLALGSYFANAATYSVSPTGQGVTISGSTLTISAAAERNGNYTVTATNLTGQSVSDSFALSVTAADASAQRVILVTDYAGDCDDALAVLLACDAHERGEINLLGIVASSTVATSAPGIYGQLAAYNMTSIPVYAYQGSVGTYNNRVSAAVRDMFGVQGQTRTAFQDDVVGLRTMLAAAPNNSVKIIDVGAPISTSRLLDSPADAISPLTGRQLIEQKVVGLWMMAGDFVVNRAEYNADRHVPSTQNVYQTWPTPIVAHGGEVGMTVYTGPMPNANPLIDPVKVAFDSYESFSPLVEGKRRSWDPICVHQAIYGNQNLYTFAGQNGTITVENNGRTIWSATPAGNRAYVGKAATAAQIAAALQAIIDNTTVMQNLNASVPAQVAIPTVTGSSASRNVSWVKPATGGSPITSYVVRVNGAVAGTVPGNVINFTIPDMAVGDYSVTVAAVNGRGEGQQSPARTFSVAAPPVGGGATNIAYAMEEGGGQTLTSRAGEVANGTGMTWETSPLRVVFNGSTGRFVSPAPATALNAEDFVISAVVRASSISGSRIIGSRNGSNGTTQRKFQFRNEAGALQYVASTSTGSSAVVTAPAGSFPVNVWLMVSAYVTSTRVQLRINGVAVQTGTFAAENRSGATEGVSHEWGCRFNPSTGSRVDYFAGDMAAVAITYGATTATAEQVEAELRAIATAKGIALP